MTCAKQYIPAPLRALQLYRFRGLDLVGPCLRLIMLSTAWIALCVITTPMPLHAQESVTGSTAPRSTFLASLSRYEQGASTPTGDLKYATALVRLTAPRVNTQDLSKLARRLASTDQSVRGGKHNYVPEKAVATAFNRLMARVQGSYTALPYVNADTVHALREVLAGNSADLTSLMSHPHSCLPDEAVLLVLLLSYNNGTVIVVRHGQTPPRIVTSGTLADAAANAGLRLDQYAVSHSKGQDVALFSNMLTDLGVQ